MERSAPQIGARHETFRAWHESEYVPTVAINVSNMLYFSYYLNY